jgi:iron-sulfur cluster repair protein YtfE (RIC family)
MVLADHANLRTRLARLASCLDTEQIEAHGDRIPEARKIFASLATFFLAHLKFEDEYLVPLLRDDFAWGDMRARATLVHHAEQREELTQLRELVESESTDPVELRATLEQFIALLDIDMMHEESGILSPEVLGDHIVNVEAGA